MDKIYNIALFKKWKIVSMVNCCGVGEIMHFGDMHLLGNFGVVL